MRIHGIQLNEGSSLTNAVIASGPAFPDNPNVGELFYRSDESLLYVHDGNVWASVASSGEASVTLTGDVSGSGSGTVEVTLTQVGTPGTYRSVTTDAKGRITGGTNPTTLAGYGITDARNTTDTIDITSGGTGATTAPTARSNLGLGNVDNTSDANKPVSTAQQTALNLKAPLASPAFTGTPTGITKTHVGLSNVDNTSDAAKPISTATQTALNTKASNVSPTFTGLLTADSIVSNGGVGVGGGVSSSQSLRVTKSITGGIVAMGIQSDGTVQSDVTAIAVGVNTNMKTVAASFTLANLYHFYASQSALGVGSVVTNQYGYAVDASLVGATNNYAFYGNIPSATGRWNLYMAGTAANYLSGKLLIGNASDNGDKLQVTGSTSLLGNVGIGFQGAANLSLSVNRSITGSTTAFGVRQSGIAQTDVTAEVMSFASYSNTVAAAYTLPDFEHFFVGQGTLGAGSAITRQSGFYVASNMTGAANNYAVNLNLAAGLNRWNIYAQGTASNYLAGKLLIGVGVGDQGEQLQVIGATRLNGALTVTGAVTGVTKTHVGLGNVDNTSDINKPVSTLQQAALDLKLSLSGGVMTGPITEEVFALAGTIIDPTNGTIQTKTLASNTTFTESLASGQSVVLMLSGASSYIVTWPAITWISSAGNIAPTLSAANAIVFWKIGSTLYGAVIGSFA